MSFLACTEHSPSATTLTDTYITLLSISCEAKRIGMIYKWRLPSGILQRPAMFLDWAREERALLHVFVFFIMCHLQF